ncbi:MAG: type I methionyl aminopeptidase [Patescibacteria group bacterium]
MKLKTEREIKILREGGKRLAHVIGVVAQAVAPGVATAELDAIAEREINRLDCRPAFKGYSGYPATACVSVNNQVVHGIPQADIFLETGDIVGIDLGLVYEKLYTDMALTVPVGVVSDRAAQLIDATRIALERGIAAAQPGGRVGDIGHAVESYATSRGFSVVRQLVGHGVGYQVHEPPQVPNYGRSGTGPELAPGLVIAIEPMLNLGTADVETLEDGWTIVTTDGEWSAHFEHTIAITRQGPLIITAP